MDKTETYLIQAIMAWRSHSPITAKRYTEDALKLINAKIKEPPKKPVNNSANT